MKVLVTGGTGFIGRALIARLSRDRRYSVRGTVRREGSRLPEAIETAVVGDMTESTDWRRALVDVDIVVHTAARVHVMRDSTADSLDEFRKTNVAGTLNLARQAAVSGVGRMVFLSSIGVNGAETTNRAFTAEDAVAPHSSYAQSKLEAELGLEAVAEELAIEVVIIRPPLVYGPGAPGNFGVLVRWLRRGIPLPLGSVSNKRSLVGLDNLVDLIVTCLQHPAAANQTFMVSDGEDLSTPDLLCRLGAALGRPVRLLPVPVWLLQAGAALLGKQVVARQLVGSLQVDISKTCARLGWSPPVSVKEGLRNVEK